MKDLSPEKVALLANQIAIEMAKGKTIPELNLLRSISMQISAVLQTIITQKINQDTK